MQYKNQYQCISITANQIKSTVRNTAIKALEKGIATYVFLGAYNNYFTLKRYIERDEPLMVLDDLLYPEKTIIYDSYNRPIVQRIDPGPKEIESNIYEELLTDDLQKVIANGKAGILGFKSDLVGHIKRIKNHLYIRIDDLFFNVNDLFRFTKSYVKRESIEERNKRLLLRAVSLWKEHLEYRDIISTLLTEENLLRNKKDLPPMPATTMEDIVRKRMIIDYISNS